MQAQMGMGMGMGQVVPSWATKRAVEDAETAREKVVDGKFTLRMYALAVGGGVDWANECGCAVDRLGWG